MPLRGLDATIFVEHATEFEYRDGLFYVVDRFGNSTIRRVYCPQVFMASLLQAEKAIDEWRNQQLEIASNVVPIYPVQALSA